MDGKLYKRARLAYDTWFEYDGGYEIDFDDLSDRDKEGWMRIVQTPKDKPMIERASMVYEAWHEVEFGCKPELSHFEHRLSEATRAMIFGLIKAADEAYD